jgi:lipooligosaccharide transport system permease protein
MSANQAFSARRRLRSIEPTAIAGVMAHDLAVFKRYWLPTTFSAIVEPAINLLAFGFGLGSLIAHVNGYRYLDFIGTGVVGMAILFSAAFTGMFQTFIRRTFQHTYDAVLAAPVDTHELVTGEALWIGAKAGVYGCAPILVAVGFGLRPSAWVVLIPLIGFVTGLGFGLFGIWMSALVPNIDGFNYIISAVITPLLLVAGTYFPINTLPGWARSLSVVNPLYHCVELVRDAVFAQLGWNDVGHALALVVFAVLMWVAAVFFLRRKLID